MKEMTTNNHVNSIRQASNKSNNSMNPNMQPANASGYCMEPDMQTADESSMNFRPEALPAYELVERRTLTDLASEGIYLKHKKTGARIALIMNQDDNKVFSIGFRTPPQDSTGVAHILEHSVLCGSRDFPVKDPFIELVKGSLNTFLNAMTYPDKTVYPVASCNDKDFQNLMHVYLDAVFYPKVYETPEIFRQEGWHYELPDEDGELTINGVVYSEMKGVFSSPDDVLARHIMNSLYPETPYGYESGGDPDSIPSLTYEQFLDFHRKFYHPSNSYIYLYGDMDMTEKLQFLDEKYLSAFDALEADSHIEVQPPFTAPRRLQVPYPIADHDKEEESAYLSWNVSIGDSLDCERNIAMQILEYALGSAPGAPLKKALTEAGIGKEIDSVFDNGLQQPYFSVVSKGSDLSREEEFLTIIERELRKAAEDGIDRKALLAGINYYEFRYREADYGRYPKGLMYGLQMLDSWLYDDTKAFVYLEQNEIFAALRQKADTAYFEDIIKTSLLANPHLTVIALVPKKGLTAEREQALKEELAVKKADMDNAALSEIFETQKELDSFREREDLPEDIAKIPLLRREDLKKEANLPIYEVSTLANSTLLVHDLFTNGIGYLRFIFSLDQIPSEYFPYIGILEGCLGLLNTAHYSYGDLFNEINMHTGGIQPVTNVFPVENKADTVKLTLEFKVKALYSELNKAIQLLEEVMLTSDYGDSKRLYEILAERKSSIQAHMTTAGDAVAAGQAMSYGSLTAAYTAQLSGLPHYRFLAELESNYDARKEELSQKLVETAEMIFRPENLMIDFTGAREEIVNREDQIKIFRSKLYDNPVKKEHYVPELTVLNEGLTTPGQIQYVCRAGNFVNKGLPYRGELRALKVMLSYEYLWSNIRVKGGAYGCRCSFSRNGDSSFTTYRDPQLRKSVQVFEEAADAVAGFQTDERVMTQYIIGAVSGLDQPLPPSSKGLYGYTAYMSEVDNAALQRERDELLAAEPENIRELAGYIRAFMDDHYFCVVGNAQRIQEEQELFHSIKPLV
jgi:Zn-dependent M16 (insulinase) family peptidase